MIKKEKKVSEKTTTNELALPEEGFSDIPGYIRDKALVIFKSRNKAFGFRQDCLRESTRFAKRIATLLSGLKDSGQITESGVVPLETESDIILFIQKKLGFYTFQEILKQSPKKQKYITQAAQGHIWKSLNNLNADPKYSNRIKSPAEYVEKYKRMLTSIKARMFLAEIIDTNIKDDAERAIFFRTPKTVTGREIAGASYLNYRIVFGYIVIQAYTASTNKPVKTLEDYVGFKQYCIDRQLVFDSVQEFICSILQDKRMGELVVTLPELTDFYEAFEDVIKTGTLRKLISYLGQPEVEHAYKIWDATEMVAKWTIRFEARESMQQKKWYDNYFCASSLSNAFRLLPQSEFIYMIERFPHLAIFLSLYDIIYYHLTQENETKRQAVFKYVNKTLIAEAEAILDNNYTVREFILKYAQKAQDGDQTILHLIKLFSRIEFREHNPERTETRARNYMLKALDEFPLDIVILLIETLTACGADINSVMPESLRAYLWYRYKDVSNKPITVDCPNEYLKAVEPDDLAKYLGFKRTIKEVRQSVSVLEDKEEDISQLPPHK
jgi:hypothetical protein